jgi:hypothetical protein
VSLANRTAEIKHEIGVRPPFRERANSAYKGPYVSDAIRRTVMKPGERRQNQATMLAS